MTTRNVLVNDLANDPRMNPTNEEIPEIRRPSAIFLAHSLCGSIDGVIQIFWFRYVNSGPKQHNTSSSSIVIRSKNHEISNLTMIHFYVVQKKRVQKTCTVVAILSAAYPSRGYVTMMMIVGTTRMNLTVVSTFSVMLFYYWYLISDILRQAVLRMSRDHTTIRNSVFYKASLSDIN